VVAGRRDFVYRYNFRLDRDLTPTLIILVALSIRDADISPFDDISTRRGSSQYLWITAG
jgi:hypothetical protein